ncbi:MAG TPA: Uma2 family endonuclease [Isosphaeraceae bacterium]
MATATRTPAIDSGVVPYRLNIRQFERMIDAGIFPDGVRVELLGGVLVEKMTKNDPHDFSVGRLGKLLRTILPGDWIVREEKSVTLGRSWRPEPDLAVIRGPDDLYRQRSPQSRDIGLVVEVADVSYAKDRGAKWRGYAEARVRVYWIVHLAKRQVEVYSDPKGRGVTANYRVGASYDADAEVPVVIVGAEVGRIPVRDILP